MDTPSANWLMPIVFGASTHFETRRRDASTIHALRRINPPAGPKLLSTMQPLDMIAGIGFAVWLPYRPWPTQFIRVFATPV